MQQRRRGGGKRTIKLPSGEVVDLFHSDFKPEYCQMLIDHMAAGNSYYSFAALIGVSFDVLHDWEKQYEEWAKARRVGDAMLLKYDESVGKIGVLGKIKNFNARAWEVFMRARWRDFYYDKRKVELTVNRADELKELSDEDLNKLLEEQLKSGITVGLSHMD